MMTAARLAVIREMTWVYNMACYILPLHYDRYHDDDSIEDILALARQIHPNVVAAQEGLEVPV